MHVKLHISDLGILHSYIVPNNKKTNKQTQKNQKIKKKKKSLSS